MKDRGRVAVLAFFGLVSVAAGALFMVYLYAFASMVNPAIQGGARSRKILGNLFGKGYILGTELALFMIIAGLFLSGVALSSIQEGRIHPGWKPPAVAGAVVMLLAYILTAVGCIRAA